jgi:para-nitrobenzyl esterase
MMKIHRLSFACLLGALLGFPLWAAIPGSVHTDRGLVGGTVRNGIAVFKGIPYAAPPVGRLRWQSPQPAARWENVRAARRFSASCMQQVQHQLPWTAEYNIGPPYSENCLYLNVWTAARSSQERRPVLLWIHGGGFMVGSGSVPIYDGSNLARKGLVVVTINYRLGVFGFFANSGLAHGSPHYASGDYGMLDMIAALRWVQRNISAFGGNPANVTIAGQSAGAAAVHLLIQSPLACGLFNHAIAESGSGVGEDHAPPLAQAEKADEKWLTAIGAPSLTKLRKMPAVQLQGIAAASHMRFGPVVDGWFLPSASSAAKYSRRGSDVPIMTGMTADDIGTRWQQLPVTATSFRQTAEKRFAPMASKFLALYPGNSDAEAIASAKQAGRDRMLTSMYLWGAKRSQTKKTPAYMYYFSRVTPGSVGAVYGAFHASDVPYFFDNLQESPRPWKAVDHRLASVMSSYWVRFATSGDPNEAGLPNWPAFHEANPETMELGSRIGPRPIAAPAKLSFFTRTIERSIAPAQPNPGGAGPVPTGKRTHSSTGKKNH